MKNETLSLSLRLCLLANKVILALNHFLAKKWIPQDNVLEDALEFMEDVKHGRELVKNWRLSEGCVEASKVYGKALRVVEMVYSQSPQEERNEAKRKGLDAIFDSYTNSINNLLKFSRGETEEIDSSQVVRLKEFFKVLRQIALAENAAPIERVVGM